jgi:hypothetical protein
MIYVELLLLIVAVSVGWLLTLMTLPGLWLSVGSLALFAWLVPEAEDWGISWTVVIVALVLALLGEAAEFAASALGAAKHGGSKRGAALAIVGSLVGAMVGAPLGIPIPVIGSIVGILLGACLGALVGAMLGETWKGRTTGEAWRVGQGAFWGRLAGSLAKIAVATGIELVALAAIVLSLFR